MEPKDMITGDPMAETMDTEEEGTSIELMIAKDVTMTVSKETNDMEDQEGNDIPVKSLHI